MKVKGFGILLFGLIFILSGCLSMSVSIHNYHTIAVVPVESPDEAPEAGSIIADQLVSQIIKYRMYQVISLDQTEDLLEDSEFVIEQALKSGIDALVIIMVSRFAVEEYDGFDEVKSGITEENITVSDDAIYAKKGIAVVEAQMIDTKTNEIIQLLSKTKVLPHFAFSKDQIVALPTDEEIMEQITSDITGNFAILLSPRRVGQQRKLINEKDNNIKPGIKYAKKGLWEKAKEQWLKAFSENPDSAAVCNNLAVYYDRNGDYENAVFYYNAALEIAPDNTNIMNNLMQLEQFMGNDSE